MALVDLGTDKQNLPASTAAGAVGVRLATSLDGERVPLSSTCEGCTKSSSHGPPCVDIGYRIPHGEEPSTQVAATNDVSATEAARLRYTLRLLHYIAYGTTKDVLYNVGVGGSISQSTTYEIVSASGKIATLRGPHPGRVIHGTLILNPDWPGIDPETGEPEPRLIPRLDVGALPLGAMAEFLYPSVLYRKQKPHVVRIEYPTTDYDEADNEVEFDVEFSQNIASARAPYDLKFPPADGAYRVRLWYEFNTPEPHPNYQPHDGAQWVRVEKTFLAAACASGPVALTNSQGAPTRVISPGIAGSFPLSRAWRAVANRTGAATSLVTISDAMVAHTDTGSSWSTTLDLTAVATLFGEDLVSVTVSYYAEAAAEDAPEVRLPWLGSCANSQFDPSLSATHEADGWHCTNIECSKFVAGTYRRVCWAPRATHFALGSATASTGDLERAKADVRDASWWARAWSDATWRIDQLMEGASGARAYQLVRLGGPSLLEMVGGFVDRVPGGNFPRRELWRAPAYGARVTYSPADRGETGTGTKQALQHGLWIAQAAQDTTSASKTPGLVPSIVDGWRDRLDSLGTATSAQDEHLECYNRYSVGNQTAYDYQHQGQALRTRCRKGVKPEEWYSVGTSLTAPENPLITRCVRDWAAGAGTSATLPASDPVGRLQFSKFGTPLTIDGVQYGGMLRVIPRGPATSRPAIVSGVVEAVELVSGSVYRITAKRGPQVSDVDWTPPGGKPVNIAINWLGGGNICSTSEDLRGISWRNNTRRGPDLNDRGIRGDGVAFEKSGLLPLVKCTRAVPHSVSPIGGVDYRIEDPGPTVTHAQVALYALDLTLSYAGGEVFFEEDNALFPTCIVRSDPGGVLTTLALKDFGDVLADDAAFDAGVAQYWFDEGSYSFRLSDAALAVASFAVAYYWVRGLRGPVTPADGALLALVGNAGSGYGGTLDTLARASWGTRGNFDVSVTWWGGDCSFEWRPLVGRDSPVIYLGISSGVVTAVGYRATAGAALSIVATPAAAISPGTVLRIAKTGGTVALYAGATLLHSQAMSGVITATDGLLAIAKASSSSSCRFVVPNGTELVVQDPGDTGELAIYANVQSDVEGSYAIPRLPGRTITEVHNETADAAMTSGGTARNRYVLTSDAVVCYGIHNSDVIRISYSAEVLPEDYRGRAPRVPSDIEGNPLQQNFAANVEGSDPVEATSDPAENRANWHDSFDVEWEGPGAFPVVAGESFTFYRHGVLDESPAVSYDVVNGEGDWTALAGSQFRTLRWEGVILLTKTLLDSLTGSICWKVRAEAPMRVSGGFEADIVNEQKWTLENWDQAWCRVGYSGSAPNVVGAAYQHIVATGWACSGMQVVATGLAAGVTSATIAGNDGVFPFWTFNAGVNGYAFVDSDATGETVITCSGNDLTVPNATAGGMATEVYPEGRTGPDGEPDNYWGMGFSETLPVPFAGEGSIIGVTGLFKFTALGFTADQILPYIPDGAEIVEAKIDFKADGLRSREESITTEVSAYISVTDELTAVPVSRTQSRNGVIYYAWDAVNGVTVDDEPPADRMTSPVGFQLVGVRSNTRNITLFDDSEAAIPDNQYQALGEVSVVTTAEDGEWLSIDCTSAIQAVVDDHGTTNGSYQLWPVNAVSTFLATDGALSQYARALVGNFSVSASTSGGFVSGWTATASGTYTYCDSIAFGALLVRFRLPGEPVRDVPIPLFRPPFVREVE